MSLIRMDLYSECLTRMVPVNVILPEYKDQRKLDNGLLTTVAGSGEEGFVDGAAAEACFSSPMGLAVDAQGRVYVADTVNGAVRRISDGQVDTLVMSKPDSPQRWPVSPIGLQVLGSSLYVCDNFTGKLMCVNIG